jgi:hypothetical protein
VGPRTAVLVSEDTTLDRGLLRCGASVPAMSLVGQLHALPRRSIAVCFTSDSGYKHQPYGLLVRPTSRALLKMVRRTLPLEGYAALARGARATLFDTFFRGTREGHDGALDLAGIA